MKHLKGLGMISFFAVVLVFGAGYGNTIANSSDSQNSNGKEFIAITKEEKAWSDYVDKEIETKMFEAFNDAFKSFNVNTNDYSYYSLHEAPKNIKEIKSSKDAFLLKRAAIDAVTNDIKSGDFMPGLFVNKDGTIAFITFKELETGKNHIYWLKLNTDKQASINSEGEISNVWEITSAEKKDGEKIEALKVKSLEEFISQQ
ncbi:hypothetical protein ACQKK5_26205 [Brevibacillus panacihumi]|uniref:hypothetical protein n=1 Tax=Brevibacillus panacihumi TaxID=497735 RepID=UPI003D041B72